MSLKKTIIVLEYNTSNILAIQFILPLPFPNWLQALVGRVSSAASAHFKASTTFSRCVQHEGDDDPIHFEVNYRRSFLIRLVLQQRSAGSAAMRYSEAFYLPFFLFVFKFSIATKRPSRFSIQNELAKCLCSSIYPLLSPITFCGVSSLSSITCSPSLPPFHKTSFPFSDNVSKYFSTIIKTEPSFILHLTSYHLCILSKAKVFLVVSIATHQLQSALPSSALLVF